MKLAAPLCLVSLAILIPAAPARSDVLYSEPFNLGQSLADAGWSSDCWGQNYYGAGASISIAPDSAHDPANGYAYLSAYNCPWSGAVALYTTEPVNISTASPLTIGWDMIPYYDGWRAAHHLAVQVGGQWYSSSANLIPPTFDVQWNTLSIAYDPAAANWLTLTLNPATHDATVGAAPSAPLAGNITGLGIVWTPGQAKFQIGIDNFLVLGAPSQQTWHPGDANKDGLVNLEDFGLLKDNFGATAGATWAMGDFNTDGAINLEDFGLLKDHFGHTAGDSPLAAVPEPTTVVFLSVTACGFAIRRRRPPGRRLP